MSVNKSVTKKKKVIKKRIVAIAIVQFTFRGILYKIGDSFNGKQNEENSLINKKLIKWQ
tara:strand:- start:606 stop:782 length:177 start_codon:yes stop_codon:yes gene_type:complete